jgi:hypothetical protein
MKNTFTFFILFIILNINFTKVCQAQEFSEHLIANNYNSWSTLAIDMDNDEDIDIVGSSRIGNKVAWWENDGSENFTEHVISTTAWYAMVVSAADMDGDEDIDIVCAAQEADAVLWWENDGSQDFTQHVAANIISPSYIYLADVDSDEDQDILVAACEDNSNKIVWLENTGQTSFTTHIIKENWDHANSIFAADMDSDGDMDVLATASFRTATQNGEVSWFENDGEQNFSEQNIINNYGRPSCAIATDIDNDGDMDVIASVCVLHRIILFENDGLQNFTNNIITTNFFRPHSVFAADMDNDGDQDILGAAINLNQIAWFENDNNDFTKQIVSNTFDGTTCVYAEDIDSDGDQDILGAAQFGNQIKWWESDLTTGIGDNNYSLLNKNLNLFCYPNPSGSVSTFTYTLYEKSQVVLKIINSKGQEIKTLVNDPQSSGEKFVTWDGTDINKKKVSSGIYYYTLKAGNNIVSRKIIKF